jgi:hypothetical protein
MEDVRAGFIDSMRHLFAGESKSDDEVRTFIVVYVAGFVDAIEPFSNGSAVRVANLCKLMVRIARGEDPLERWKWWNQQTEESQPKEPECPPT